MKQIFRLACILIATTCLGCSLKGQVSSSYSNQIDSLLKTRQPRSFNGVVLIAQEGKIKYAKAHGYADFDKKIPLKTSDRFSTMSIAKQVTAALILQEVEKGRIDLHVPVKKYLPALKYSWADTVTVHQLLNHTSGLQADDMDRPLKFAPGKEFSYSNIGYSLAGQVLEKQSGKTYQQLVNALFKKCGMTGSAYPTVQNRQLLAKGHTIQKDGKAILRAYTNFRPLNYFGSHLMVTAADLVKWNEYLHNGKILRPETYALMVSSTTTAIHPLFSNNPIGYGYGLRINDLQGYREIGHTGFHPAEGFTAVNLYYPETRTSIIVLENQANENFDIAYHFEQEVRKIMANTNLVNNHTASSGSGTLHEKINAIITATKGITGVSVVGPDNKKTEINGDRLFPMLSTFKFPVALAILNKVEKQELSLAQKILIRKEELLSDTWSPFKEKYPEGGKEITLEEAMMWMTAYSDNNITDILLRLIGGTGPVAQFINSKDCIIKNNEEAMHKDWESQFVNKITPNESIRLLRQFDEGKMLNAENTKWLYTAMANNTTGPKRLKGKLAPEVVVAHRTGTSFTNDAGITGAINNFGIIELPGKQKLYIAVFVQDTSELFSKGEEIIADIAKASYDHYK